MYVDVTATESSSGKDVGKSMWCHPSEVKVTVPANRSQHGMPVIELSGEHLSAEANAQREYWRTCSVRLSLQDVIQVLKVATENGLLELAPTICWKVKGQDGTPGVDYFLGSPP